MLLPHHAARALTNHNSPDSSLSDYSCAPGPLSPPCVPDLTWSTTAFPSLAVLAVPPQVGYGPKTVTAQTERMLIWAVSVCLILSDQGTPSIARRSRRYDLRPQPASWIPELQRLSGSSGEPGSSSRQMAQRRTMLLSPCHGVRTPENRNAPTLAYVALLSMPSVIDLNMEHE